MTRAAAHRITPKRQQRRSTAKRGDTDIWRPTGPLPEIEPLNPAQDPTALLRSLGEPPLATGQTALHHYVTVVERSAATALALAISAGALTDDPTA